MTEGKKIGLACAIGGAIGTVVALYVAAPFWWLGLLAGFSGGYVSYEFRTVLRVIPQAWRMTVGGIGVVGDLVIAFFRGLFRFLFTNPILHFALLDLAIFALVFNLGSFELVVTTFIEAVPYVIGLIVFTVFIVAQMVVMDDKVIGEFSYSDVAKWYGLCALAALAVGIALLTMPVLLPFVALYFLYKLIHLVHSDKRLLCGVDAAIGTGVAYVTLARPEMTLAQYALVIAAGAMIGAAFGVLNYEVVSKRILHLNGDRVTQ